MSCGSEGVVVLRRRRRTAATGKGFLDPWRSEREEERTEGDVERADAGSFQAEEGTDRWARREAAWSGRRIPGHILT